MRMFAFARYTVCSSTIFGSSTRCRKTHTTMDLLRFVLTFALLFATISLGCHPAAAQTTFQHPGVLVSRAQLDFIKAQVAAHADPIYTAYQKAVASPYGSLTYTVKGPPAGGIIDCGPFSSPDHGCSASDSDGTAALTQALLWYISGNHVYAQNAINILNTYSRNLKGGHAQAIEWPYPHFPFCKS